MNYLNRRALLALAAAFVATWASAQSFPSKPIKIVVPFPPGGPVDGLARALGRELGDSLGQPVIVENKPGANTIIAADQVARSAPDGHTLLLTTDSTVSINPLIYSKLPFDPQTDLMPVTVLTHVPEYLVVRADLPVNTLQEFIALAKSKPGALNYGSFGKGSSAHLEFEAFRAAAGVNIVHIPYKGAAEVYPAMLAGQIDAAITSPVAPLPHIRAGKLKALAVMGERRTTLLPEVPTFTEAGVPGFDVNSWFGLLAPGKTPAPIIERLAAETAKVVTKPQFRERYIEAIGLLAAPHGTAYFTKLLESDREKYAKYVKAANLKPE